MCVVTCPVWAGRVIGALQMQKLAPCSLLTFVFLWFALGRSMFLFQGLSLAVLSPPAQLKVDKFPHHEGLSEADGCQDSYPTREGKQWLKKNALMLVYNEFHTWCQLNLELAIIAAPHNISLCLNAPRKKREEFSPLALTVLGKCRTVSLILIVFNKVGPHFTRPALEARQIQRKGTRSSLKWCNEQSWMCGNHFLRNVIIFAICHTSKSKLNQSKTIFFS